MDIPLAPGDDGAMNGCTLLLIGNGYTARTLAGVWNGPVVSTTRDTPGRGQIPFGGSAMRDAAARADVIVSSVPPGKTGDPVMSALPDLAPVASQARAVIYFSATSVYGDTGGAWVDEDAPVRPTTARGRRRAEAELEWLDRMAEGLPVHLLRLAGIYGPERSPFARLRAGEARAVVKPGHTTNRIHVDDIATLILAIAADPQPDIYNVADGHPAPPEAVLDCAADLLGIAHPPRLGPDDPSLSPMARSFYAETKRVDALRARSVFGWAPRHSDYRTGLRSVLERERGGSVDRV